jgi:hypothetical protein
MDGHGERSHNVKRVLLPSGKTIDVAYRKGSDPLLPPDRDDRAPEHPSAKPQQDLHVCLECSSVLVHPVQREGSGNENWSTLLHCPNCDVYREGIFSQQTVEAFDEELDRGANALLRDYKRLMRENMAAELERFVRALNADAILPEDF